MDEGNQCLRCPAPPSLVGCVLLVTASLAVGLTLSVGGGVLAAGVGYTILWAIAGAGALALLAGIADAVLLVRLLVKNRPPAPLFSSALTSALGLTPEGLFNAHYRFVYGVDPGPAVSQEG